MDPSGLLLRRQRTVPPPDSRRDLKIARSGSHLKKSGLSCAIFAQCVKLEGIKAQRLTAANGRLDTKKPARVVPGRPSSLRVWRSHGPLRLRSRDVEEGLASAHCADLPLVSERRAFLVSARRCPDDVLVATVAPPVAMLAGAFAVPKLTRVGF